MKKTFKDSISPAMQFISPPLDAHPTDPEDFILAVMPPKPSVPQDASPKGYKPNPLYLETKSKRLQLLLQPSLFDRIKKHAAANGTSVNECIHTMLEKATK